MGNHPNRGRKAPGSNPEPAEIRAARDKTGMTQTEAALLVYATLRAWQDWESGARRMHPATWALWRLKVKYPRIEEELLDKMLPPNELTRT